eukprot:13675482-Alexandrium_andersonii.AAC.1
MVQQPGPPGVPRVPVSEGCTMRRGASAATGPGTSAQFAPCGAVLVRRPDGAVPGRIGPPGTLGFRLRR